MTMPRGLGAYTAYPCRFCTGPRRFGHYLCRDCWGALPRAARKALSKRDSHAAARLCSLHDQIDEGLPLSAICIPTTTTTQEH